MKLRIVVCLLAPSTVFGLASKAQELPKIDVSANYSYFRDNPATPGVGNFSLNGGSATAAYNFRDWLSGVADFGGYDVGRVRGVNVDNHILTYMFCPQISYRKYRRITPFGHVFGGGARAGSGVVATPNSHTALST